MVKFCKHLLATVLLLGLVPLIAAAQAQSSCSSFQMQIGQTYKFKPSQLGDAERDKKSDEMDKVWQMVEARPGELLPCLRAALEVKDANPWFRFDGSNLLVKLDPSAASKTIQVRNYTAVDLEDVNLQEWVQTLARRGTEGFDVSEAGSRWLAYPGAKYFLPRHGAFAVRTFEGGLFIFGSMDEAQATPALLKIVNQVNHNGRNAALLILMSQATPESLQALRQLDTSSFPVSVRKALQSMQSSPSVFMPRAKPKTSRETFLKAFQEIVNGNWDKFSELVDEVPDGERDVVAVMQPEDLPLIRKVRRVMIAGGTPHSIEYYNSFTGILMTMIAKQGEPVPPKIGT